MSGPDWARFLDPGEVIAWQGRPRKGLSLVPVLHIVRPIVMLWGVIGTAFLAGLTLIGVPGIGLAALGVLAFIGGQVWLIAAFNARKRGRLSYALTDRCALIHDAALPDVVTEVTLLDPEAVTLEDGQLVLGRGPLRYMLESGGTQTTWQHYACDLIDGGDAALAAARAAARHNAPERPEGQPWTVIVDMRRATDSLQTSFAPSEGTA